MTGAEWVLALVVVGLVSLGALVLMELDEHLDRREGRR